MSLDQLIPCGEQLLVRRDPPELRCGELVIPETSVLGVTTSGVIVKVGPRAHGFAKDERVIFGILAGRALAREGVSSEEEYRLLPASDVQCKIAGYELRTWDETIACYPTFEEAEVERGSRWRAGARDIFILRQQDGVRLQPGEPRDATA